MILHGAAMQPMPECKIRRPQQALAGVNRSEPEFMESDYRPVLPTDRLRHHSPSALGHTAWRIERGWHEHCGIRRFDRRYRGMPAQLVILTGDRTPLDYILGPLREGVMIAMRES
jgi:hypothetical protein